MIYLIKSAGYKEEEGNISTFFLLKIGYTEDNRKDTRFVQYKLHNPTCQILYIIPEATEEHEKKVQYKFKNLLFPDYGREWFKYSEEIINFFKNIKSLEELDNLSFPSNSRIRYGLAKKIVSKTIIINNILEKSEKVNNFIKNMISILGKDIRNKNKIIEFLRNNEEINQVDLDRYIDKKSGKEIIYSPDDIINQEVSDFMKIYFSYGTMYDKLRLLCEYGLSKNALNIVLSQLADSDEIKSYYTSLGPQRLKALGYSVTRIKHELGIVTFSLELLVQEIYSNFKEGEKYTLSNLKNKLGNIYSSINYSATPKANDIENYFNIKEISIYEKKEDGGRKRIKAYELLKSKEQELRQELKHAN